MQRREPRRKSQTPKDLTNEATVQEVGKSITRGGGGGGGGGGLGGVGAWWGVGWGYGWGVGGVWGGEEGNYEKIHKGQAGNESSNVVTEGTFRVRTYRTGDLEEYLRKKTKRRRRKE